MALLGNFPSAPAAELPEGVVGYLHYNNGTKLPLTKVEAIPDVTTVQGTVPGTSKALYFSADSYWDYYIITTEDGYYKEVGLDGIVRSSVFRGHHLTAQDQNRATTYAYTNEGIHYFHIDDNNVFSSNSAPIISCYYGTSLDAAGVINSYEGVYNSTTKVVEYSLKWSTTIEGCTLIGYCLLAAVGSIIKILNSDDGSILGEVDIGHNIVRIAWGSYILCDDGYVVHFDRYSTTSSSFKILWSHNFGKRVNHIEELNGKYFVCYADGTVAKVTLDFKEAWSYSGNTSAALFAAVLGWGAQPTIIVARESGDVEFLSITPGGVKVYFDNAALDEGTSE